jgi:hypothetical protein
MLIEPVNVSIDTMVAAAAASITVGLLVVDAATAMIITVVVLEKIETETENGTGEPARRFEARLFAQSESVVPRPACLAC